MDLQIINLNTPYGDWRADVARILTPLTGAHIATRLQLSGGVDLLDQKLTELRHLFLVSDCWFERTLEMRGSPEFYGESPLHRGPGLAPGGAIVEPLGIYVHDLETFASSLSCELAEPFSDRIQGLSPDGNPLCAILISPERIFELPYHLVKRLGDEEARPPARLNMTELYLRMTLFHELGHHLFPAPPVDGSQNFISEALANHCCEALLEPRERLWLFLKARHLQPPSYISYFIPKLLAGMPVEAPSPAVWPEILRISLSRSATFSSCSLFWPVGTAPARTPILSHHTHVAAEGLAEALHEAELLSMLEKTPPCDLAPEEELQYHWSTDTGLVRLLLHAEWSVQKAAAKTLSERFPSSEAAPQDVRGAFTAWLDLHMVADDKQESLEAGQLEPEGWLDGREQRWRRVLLRRESEVVRALLHRMERGSRLQEYREFLSSVLESDAECYMSHVLRSALVLVAGKLGDLATVARLLEAEDWVFSLRREVERLREAHVVLPDDLLRRIAEGQLPALAAVSETDDSDDHHKQWLMACARQELSARHLDARDADRPSQAD